MSRPRAILMAAILFGGVCLMLGALGMMMFDSGKVLSIYIIAVLGFAAWLSWDTYERNRARQDALRSKGSVQ